MLTKEEKRQYILDYAPVLVDFANSYTNCASIIDSIPEPVFDAMFAVAVQGNEAHARIADAIEEAV